MDQTARTEEKVMRLMAAISSAGDTFVEEGYTGGFTALLGLLTGLTIADRIPTMKDEILSIFNKDPRFRDGGKIIEMMMLQVENESRA